MLYRNIGLSIHPDRMQYISKDMLSWFPMLFPFKVRSVDPSPRVVVSPRLTLPPGTIISSELIRAACLDLAPNQRATGLVRVVRGGVLASAGLDVDTRADGGGGGGHAAAAQRVAGQCAGGGAERLARRVAVVAVDACAVTEPGSGRG